MDINQETMPKDTPKSFLSGRSSQGQNSRLTRNYKKCVICNRRRIPGCDVYLARIPLDPDRCRKWIKAIGQRDLVDLPIEKLHELKFVCNLHFQLIDFNVSCNRLKEHAVPTLNLPLNPLEDDLFHDFPLHIGQYPRRETDQLFSNVAEDKEADCNTEEDHLLNDDEEDYVAQYTVPVKLPKFKAKPLVQFSWNEDNAVVPFDDLEERLPPASRPPPRAVKDETPALDHTHYQCNFCNEAITGFRYTCVQCADVDLCGACEARQAHHAHYVLRIPQNRPLEEVAARLHTIRRVLLADDIANVTGDALDAEVEVKDEVNQEDYSKEEFHEEPIEVETAQTDAVDKNLSQDPLDMDQEDFYEQDLSRTGDDGATDLKEKPGESEQIHSKLKPVIEPPPVVYGPGPSTAMPSSTQVITQVVSPVPKQLPVFKVKSLKKMLTLIPQQQFIIQASPSISSGNKPVLKLKPATAINSDKTIVKLDMVKPIVLKNRSEQREQMLKMVRTYASRQQPGTVKENLRTKGLSSPNKRVSEITLPREAKKVTIVSALKSMEKSEAVVRLQRLRTSDVDAALRRDATADDDAPAD